MTGNDFRATMADLDPDSLSLLVRDVAGVAYGLRAISETRDGMEPTQACALGSMADVLTDAVQFAFGREVLRVGDGRFVTGGTNTGTTTA